MQPNPIFAWSKCHKGRNYSNLQPSLAAHTIQGLHDLCHMQGIKITDADSKKKAIKLLKAEQAMREMEIDSDASDSGSDVEMK